MKSKLLFALLIGFIPFLAFSQKNNASINFFYAPLSGGDYAFFITPEYKKKFTDRSSVGIMIEFGQYVEKIDKYYENPNGRKDLYWGASVVYDYKLFGKGNHSIDVGAGPLFGTSIIYFKNIPRVGWCGNGPAPEITPEPLNHWNFEYITGLSTFLEYHYKIFDSFFIGASLRGAILYYFEFDELSPGFIPYLKVGYKW